MPGIRLGQLADRARQQTGGHRRQRGDRDEAAPVREQLVGARGDRLDVDQDALERHEQIAARLRQRDMPLVAVEQLHADGGLELLNLHGERGLRHVQLGRGAREAAGAGEREKCADMPQIVDHAATDLLSFSLITEIRTIQLSNSRGGITFNGVRARPCRPSGLPQPRVARRTAVAPVPLNLVFFGPPGAGKGTQADRFAARHRIPKISTGDMLRKAIQDGTRVGAARARHAAARRARRRRSHHLDRGRAARAARHRERVRARRLPAHDSAGRGARRAARRSRRRQRRRAGRARRRSRSAASPSRGREDDEAFVIKERLAVYSRETEPVLEYYRRRSVVTILDGNRPLDEVTEAIEQAMSKAKILNRRTGDHAEIQKHFQDLLISCEARLC